MRFFIVLTVIIVSAFALPKPQDETDSTDLTNTKEDELRAENCDFPDKSPFHWECALFKCSKDRTRVLTVPCPYSPCPHDPFYSPEFPKPYPECCPPANC